MYDLQVRINFTTFLIISLQIQMVQIFVFQSSDPMKSSINGIYEILSYCERIIRVYKRKLQWKIIN